MTLTSRHDRSAAILDKVRIKVNQRPEWTRESTAFDMGRQAALDEVRTIIEHMERRVDPISDT